MYNYFIYKPTKPAINDKKSILLDLFKMKGQFKIIFYFNNLTIRNLSTSN